MTISRRQFFATSAAAAAVGTAGSPLPLAAGIDPIKRPSAKADIKLSLAAYSYRQYLDLKKPTMTLFDFIDTAAWGPLDAVELTSYYFAETTDAYLDKIKARCQQHGLAVSGVPVGNNFCLKDDAKRKAEVQKVKDWTERAARLGATTVRIFAGNLEKGDTLEEAQKRVVDAMNECCEHADKLGIYLALENHGGITDTAEHLLELVKPVKSKALGVNVDTGNFHTPDPYADIAKIAPYGVVSQIKSEAFPNNKKEPADLARVIKIFRDTNFHGYVALEYEAAEEPKVAVPRLLKELRKLIG
jgi:sugar phosphate isomerase/epimerase